GGVFGKASLKKIFIAEEVSACRGFINPGFEYRASGGFVFRGGVYLLFLDEGFSLWPGIQMGVAF
ncbi:MAG: hypothetical protein HY962_06450, partial [Ignavibacteriae bacterium]|nr:hypothetical protein [Ignavibacteriota bacterium]